MRKLRNSANASNPMRRILLLCTLVLLLAPQDLLQAREIVRKGDVAVIPLSGEISGSLAAFVRRTAKEAETAGASAIIFEMNTYGGRLDAAEEISNVLNKTTVPTYTFINSNAGSAGGPLALSTPPLSIAPGRALG